MERRLTLQKNLKEVELRKGKGNQGNVGKTLKGKRSRELQSLFSRETGERRMRCRSGIRLQDQLKLKMKALVAGQEGAFLRSNRVLGKPMRWWQTRIASLEKEGIHEEWAMV
jgi:hypothetical protein